MTCIEMPWLPLSYEAQLPGALPGQKSQGSVTRALKLSVRHDDGGMRCLKPWVLMAWNSSSMKLLLKVEHL